MRMEQRDESTLSEATLIELRFLLISYFRYISRRLMSNF